MTDEHEGFCTDCNHKVPLIFKQRYVKSKAYGIHFTYTEEYAVCSHCGNEVYVPRLNNRNAKARASAYFEEKVSVNNVNAVDNPNPISPKDLKSALMKGEQTMSDCVMETLCTHCIHREVCSIKATYLENLSKLPSVTTDFTLTLTCRHYVIEPTIAKTNTLNFTYSDSTTTLRG